MKSSAIVFTAENTVALELIELPPLGASDVLVRSTVSGVSIGTERWALIGKRREMKFPLVTGYLGVGVIEQVGPSAGGFSVGERIFFTSACWPEPYASNSWMGTSASRVMVPTQCGVDWPPYVLKVPDGVGDGDAAMAGLMAVAVQGADMAKVTSKDTALVLGVGMIGQCAAQVFAAKGAAIVVADRVRSRVETAIANGASGVTLGDGPIAPQVAHLLPGGGADIVIDTTSVAAVVQQLGSLVKHRGQIVLQGFYPGLTPLDLDSLHGRRPTVHIACSMDALSHDYALRLVRGGQANLSSLITHRFAADRAAEAYGLLLDPPADLLGMIIEWPNG